METWWKERVVYQIYPRSFLDTNGDGIGDLPGIIKQLPILKELGVGTLWLSPVYMSPDMDFGYDICDYYTIAPHFGTMEDMDKLLALAKAMDIRILMDLVANHTSNQHEWFEKSRARIEPYTDYYIWKKGSKNKYPNNWTTFFMEPAWTWDTVREEYYLHLFSKEQPDLNFDNPLVIREIQSVMRFWLEKGVSGFRCDVINVLGKQSFENGKGLFPIKGREHYLSTQKNHEILRALRKDPLGDFDSFTVGETVFVTAEQARDLAGSERGELDMVFVFDHLMVDRRIAKYIAKPFKPEKLLKTIDSWQQTLEWNAVVWENHDSPRIVSHYGQIPDFWQKSAKALALLQFVQKGTPFLYQGQEIGMTNFHFTSLKQLQDVESINIDALLAKFHVPKKLRWKWVSEASRDNARTPMQWDSSSQAGFTTGKPWLGVNPNFAQINVESQRNDPDSIWSFYQRLIALRRESNVLMEGTFRVLGCPKGVMIIQRELEEETYVALINLTKKNVRLAQEGQVILSSSGALTYDGMMSAYDAFLLKVSV
jgi:oligo-1,6-glucosidase